MKLSILIPCKEEPRVQEVMDECEKLFPEAQIIGCSDRYGKGKGWAVRKALEEATGDYVCFIDGDMDIHPRMIKRLIPFLVDYNIVLGKKQIRGVPSRTIITFLSRVYLRIFFGFIYDTQTGIKLFKRDSLPDWKADSFAFDMEIVGKAMKAGAHIIEVPVEVTQSKKMATKSILKCFWESVTIWFTLNVEH